VKIYTKTGDRGDTGLRGGQRVSKSHPRVRAYGEVDELDSWVGLAEASLPKTKDFEPLRASLTRIQEELLTAGALLATPASREDLLPSPFDKGMPAEAASRLEKEIDRLTSDLEPMNRFILPGGAPAGALLHLARTVCRRAERELAALAQSERIPDGLLVYLNRLSDYLFTAARWTNRRLKESETQWEGLKT